MAFFSGGGQGFLAGRSGISVGGTVNGNLTVTGQVLLANGTVGAPALAFTEEPDCGLRRDTGLGNTTVMVAGGADAARWNLGGVETLLSLIVGDRLRVVPETIKTINYGVLNTDAIVVMNGTGLTATLPTTPGVNQLLFLRNNDIGTLTVDRNGQNINGAASNLTVLASTAIVLSHITGQGWWVVG